MGRYFKTRDDLEKYQLVQSSMAKLLFGNNLKSDLWQKSRQGGFEIKFVPGFKYENQIVLVGTVDYAVKKFENWLSDTKYDVFIVITGPQTRNSLIHDAFINLVSRKRNLNCVETSYSPPQSSDTPGICFTMESEPYRIFPPTLNGVFVCEVLPSLF